MIKNWLIRTKNNHILGPVTKEKIKQLISNGSIKGDDEITSGNGYWLFVREQDLVDKYIFGETAQDFNPVQESLPVLTQITSNDRRNYPVQEATDGAILPSESDLMYPGEDNSVQSQTDDTSLGIDPNKGIVQSILPATPPKVPGKARTNKKTEVDKLSRVRERVNQKSPVAEAVIPISKKVKAPLKSSMSGKKLIIITVLFLIFGLILLYFRGTVVEKLIETTSLLSSPAYAQTLEFDKKKKWFHKPEISSDLFNTSLNITPGGFYIKTVSLKTLKCDKTLTDLDLILGFYLKDKTELETFVACYNSKFKLAKQTFYRGHKVNVSDSFAKESYSIRDQSKKLNNLYKEVLKITATKINRGDNSKIFNILGELKLMKGLTAKILESFLYIKMGNTAKAESILKSLFEIDFYKHVFTSDVSMLALDRQIEIISSLVERLSRSRISQKAVEALIFYISFNSEGELKEVLEKNFTIPKTITEVQKKYETVLYGEQIPFVWAPSLFENSSRKEYVKFVKSAFKDKPITHDSELLLFREIPSLEKERKQIVLDQFFKLNSNNSNYSRYIYFLLLEDDIFYRLVKSYPREKIGLVINEKRKLLKSFLKNHVLREFALLSLLEIGDIDKSYVETTVLPYE